MPFTRRSAKGLANSPIISHFGHIQNSFYNASWLWTKPTWQRANIPHGIYIGPLLVPFHGSSHVPQFAAIDFDHDFPTRPLFLRPFLFCSHNAKHNQDKSTTIVAIWNGIHFIDKTPLRRIYWFCYYFKTVGIRKTQNK